MGKSIFASHRGQKVKKSAGGIVLGLVVFGVINNIVAGNISDANNTSYLTSQGNESVKVAPINLYPNASATATESATAGASASAKSEEEQLKAQVIELAEKAGKGWVNYDSNGVKLESLGKTPEAGQKGYEEITRAVAERNTSIKESNGRSTGAVISSEIVSMTYDGSLESGTGQATIRVKVQQTIVDKNTGEGGVSATRSYLVDLVKGSSENESPVWAVQNVKSES